MKSLNIDKSLLIKTVTIGVLFQSIISLILLLTLVLSHNFIKIDALFMGLTKVSILSYMYSVLFAPLWEEYIFKKIIYSKLKNKFSIKNSAIISSLIFAIIHFNPVISFGAFFFGYLSCKIYESSKNLIYSIIFHSVANFFSILFKDYITELMHIPITKFNNITMLSLLLITFVIAYLFKKSLHKFNSLTTSKI